VDDSEGILAAVLGEAFMSIESGANFGFRVGLELAIAAFANA
jgi:hypothetical protein